MAARRERPVLTGLVALAAVGLVVGVLVSLGALVGTRYLGLGGDEPAPTATSEADEPAVPSGDQMVLPEPQPTAEPTGPEVTLAPEPAPGEVAPGDGGAVETDAPAAPVETAPPVASGITLTAGGTAVRPGEDLTLTGTYPGADGAYLQVQRLSGDAWVDFPVGVTVRGETFSTYIRTSQTGDNRFRLLDAATGVASNEIAVAVG